MHVREHRSLLAAAEKRLLVYLANRMPAWMTPDFLTVLGLTSLAAAGAAFAAARLTPWSAAGVVAALVVNWFGDSLDGTLARVRRCERPRYGYYVDHVIDLAGTACLIGGMACSGRMSPTIALALLAAYLLVAAESYLATHAAGVFRISFAGFGPTELRIVLALGAIFMVRHPAVSMFGFPDLWLFDIGGVVAIAGLLVAFIVSAARNTRDLYAAEPLRRPATPTPTPTSTPTPTPTATLTTTLTPGGLRA